MSEFVLFAPIAAAGVAGVVLGIVYGFALASHTDVMSGTNHRPSNRFIAFFVHRSSQRSVGDLLLVLLLLLVWFVVFLVLLALPLLVGHMLALPQGWWGIASYIVVFALAFLTRPLGAKLWRQS